MSDIADKDLCAELFAISGWAGTYFTHNEFQNHSSPEEQRQTVHHTINDIDESLRLREKSYIYQLEQIPAYSLGYLLRKLPRRIDGAAIHIHPFDDLTVKPNHEGWRARYMHLFIDETYSGTQFEVEAHTAENAACSLAIQLIKSGIIPITKEG